VEQTAHLRLRTCVDACPACLAASCDIGHIDITRHTLSRRQLRKAHRRLTAGFTVAFEEGVTDAESLARLARESGGWVILTYSHRLPADLARGLRDRFDDLARIFDHERLEIRRILRLQQTA
jgi:hypothetical protein